MTNELFLAQFRQWIKDLRAIAAGRPGTGACTLATAMELWLFTLGYLQKAKDADGKPLYHSQRHGVVFPFADALCWLLASRQQILDLIELAEKGPANPVLAEGVAGYVNFFTDLCHVQAGRAAGEVGRICSELVYGYNRHSDLCTDTAGVEGGNPSSGGDLASDSLQTFRNLRNRLDVSLGGSRLAKDRAAIAVSRVEIPEALDYPAYGCGESVSMKAERSENAGVRRGLRCLKPALSCKLRRGDDPTTRLRQRHSERLKA